MDLQNFRKNLKLKLKEQKLTLNALSFRADLSEDTLRSLIYGKSQDVKISTITKIADVFGCSIDALLERPVYSAEEENMIHQLRNLSGRSIQTIQALIHLETLTTLQPSNAGKNIIPVFLPTGNMKDGQYYDNTSFETLDITEYPLSLKNATTFGIKILSANFEPLYYMNDILLLSQNRPPEYNDVVLYLDKEGKIYIRKYTTSGLIPINHFGKRIPPGEIHNYSATGVVLKVVKEFNIEQYR